MGDVIHLRVIGQDPVPLIVESDDLHPMSVERVRTIWLNPDPYEGDYEFTPTRETQIVMTKHKTLDENIRINPIPQNYGLVTYNGSIITIT